MRSPTFLTRTLPPLKINIFILGFCGLALLVTPSWQVASATTPPPIDVQALLKDLPPNYFPPGIDKALDQLRAGDATAALTQIEKTRLSWKRPLHPDRATYLQALAQLQLGDSATAYTTIKQSLALRGSNSDALFVLGKLSSNPDEQLDAFTQASLFNRFLSVRPSEALVGRARLLVGKGSTLLATTILEKAVAATPNLSEARNELASLYIRNDKKPDAIKMLREGLAIEPTSNPLRIALSKTLLIGIQRSLDKPQIDEATSLAALAYQASGPADKDAAIAYAHALIEAGKPDDAAVVIEACLKGLPNDDELKRITSQISLEKKLAAAQVTPTATAAPS